MRRYVKQRRAYRCPTCNAVVDYANQWVWRGQAFCSRDCADALGWPDPIAKAAFEQKLALMRARRLQREAD
jgi:hypothetical protein